MASDILIVDDEPDIRELVAGILKDEGHGTRTACTPKFANTTSIGGKENSYQPYAQHPEARHTSLTRLLANDRPPTPSARVSRRAPEFRTEHHKLGRSWRVINCNR